MNRKEATPTASASKHTDAHLQAQNHEDPKPASLKLRKCESLKHRKSEKHQPQTVEPQKLER